MDLSLLYSGCISPPYSCRVYLIVASDTVSVTDGWFYLYLITSGSVPVWLVVAGAAGFFMLRIACAFFFFPLKGRVYSQSQVHFSLFLSVQVNLILETIEK